jgi:ribosomal protein S18 acetylase RimI-like enzyme
MSTSEPWITLNRHYDQCLISVRRPDREVYLAWEDEKRVGFLILSMVGAFVGYIQTICVAPDARGRRLGTRIIAFAEERIFREGPNVFMCVSSFNERAKTLYLRLGYEAVGTLMDFIVAGHHEILLRKTRGPISTFTPQASGS